MRERMSLASGLRRLSGVAPGIDKKAALFCDRRDLIEPRADPGYVDLLAIVGCRTIVALRLAVTSPAERIGGMFRLYCAGSL